MYIRKQNVFTEKRVYPFVNDGDLRFDLLPRVRLMAANRHTGGHPWKEMDDRELLKSAGLYGQDKETGATGYNLAAVMLLGSDDLIRSVVPAYRTDALVRKVNQDRYDDRLVVATNLVESYYLLMGFAQKHLWDKFYLDGDARIGLRDAIAREMLANTLIHREFTSPCIARFVIEKERMFTENANRAVTGGMVTLDNFEPNPKNPIIASFFRHIGLAEELGSGVRNLYRYGRRYSGRDPELLDGDIFRITVPLDEAFSLESQSANKAQTVRGRSTDKAQNKAQNKLDRNALVEKIVLEHLSENPHATQLEIARAIHKSRRTVQEAMASLKAKGLLVRRGSRKIGRWAIYRRVRRS
jgi:ATP-dependent DNA helicase RecG